MILNVAVLDGGGVVPFIHTDQARLFDGLFIVADADIAVPENIVGVFLM